MNDIWDHAGFFFVAPTDYDPQVVKKRWKVETPDMLKDLLKVLHVVSPFEAAEIETAVKDWMEKSNISAGQLMTVWRITLVGSSQGPAVFDITATLGYLEVEKRIMHAINKIKVNEPPA